MTLKHLARIHWCRLMLAAAAAAAGVLLRCRHPSAQLLHRRSVTSSNPSSSSFLCA